MQQYFTDEILDLGQDYLLNSDLDHHFNRVLRMRQNDEFYLVDGLKKRYRLSLISAKKAKVIEEVHFNSEMPIRVRILQALIKRDKMDYFLMKATELGVHEVVFFTSSRTIVNVDQRKDNKLVRWNKLCFEAACQSKRNEVPKVLEPISWSHIKDYCSELNLVAYEDLNHPSVTLKQALKAQKSLTIVIGPEGGFTKEEIEELNQLGFLSCKLGNRILRAETAGIYALSVVSGLLEE